MENQESHLIYAFPRIPGEEVQIAIRKYKDKLYIDVRVWYQAKNEADLRPTKKGVTIAMDRLPELRKGIDRLSKVVEKFHVEEEPIPA